MKSFIFAILTVFCIVPALAADKPNYLADRHAGKGISCQMCHGQKAEPEIPEMSTCTTCHPLKSLVAKTQNVKPRNPHTSPHYQDKLDCVNCHLGHEPEVNFCDQCHNFNFKFKGK